MSLAPIALFVYNRPEHTLQTLRNLGKNKLISESELFLFCDGPRTDETAASRERIQEVSSPFAESSSLFPAYTHYMVITKSRVTEVFFSHWLIVRVSKISNPAK